MQKEQFFNCPHCFSEISVLLDPSIPEQSYVEDCEVCCNPLEFDINFMDGELTRFEVKSLDQ